MLTKNKPTTLTMRYEQVLVAHKALMVLAQMDLPRDTAMHIRRLVRVVGPLSGTAFNAGLHTVSAVGDVTLVDGKRFVNVDEQRKRVRTRKLERLKQRKRSK